MSRTQLTIYQLALAIKSQVSVLDNVSFTIATAPLNIIIIPAGCDKSTLLCMLLGETILSSRTIHMKIDNMIFRHQNLEFPTTPFDKRLLAPTSIITNDIKKYLKRLLPISTLARLQIRQRRATITAAYRVAARSTLSIDRSINCYTSFLSAVMRTAALTSSNRDEDQGF
ncbi:hypothetical protein BTUL_0163g00080 [Botrytis tulipae]|uniref:ABC transporter domain-containing protein n=1 Tax=Botrytis tulipae TaxID=87230 RepID=A0A4Z1EGD1_9HELO|nr:hypothetical protein BTUL_0163g00080 [Botrytis tulipae]